MSWPLDDDRRVLRWPNGIERRCTCKGWNPDDIVYELDDDCTAHHRRRVIDDKGNGRYVNVMEMN